MLKSELCDALNAAANQGEWLLVVKLCEKYEIECISKGIALNPSNVPLYSVHLLAYLILGDLYVF